MDFNHFLFEYRNKEYGAYQLRKLYDKTLLFSLLIVAVIFVSGFCIPLIISMKKSISENFVIRAELLPLELMDIDLPEPLPQEVLPEQKSHEQQLIPEVDSTKEALVDTAKVNSSKQKDEANIAHSNPSADDERLKLPGVFSCFDKEKFRNWFVSSFESSWKAKANSQAQLLVLNITVDKRGLIDTVKVERSISLPIDKEVVDFIKKAPRWNPCMIQGRPQIITLRFQVYLFPPA